MRSFGYTASLAVPPAANIASPALVAPTPRDLLRRVPAIRDLLALTKPRLATFSVLTAMAAYVTTPAPADGVAQPWLVLAGTALAAGGALSLNQWWERERDALMRRTRARPLPRGAIPPPVALAWSLTLGVSGCSLLFIAANLLAAGIAAATIALYGLVYTPLKRRTRWATEVGAVPGALPPLLGGAAAGDLAAAPGAWLLAVLLLFWQMPHFFAIGWIHRDDYRAAGFRVLPAVDATGARTARWSVLYTAALVPVSIAPCILGHTGAIFGVVSVAAALAFLAQALLFYRTTMDRDRAARRLFLASILHLPLVLGALTLDYAL